MVRVRGWVLVGMAWLGAVSCSPGGSSSTSKCVAADAGLDCKDMCHNYCNKLAECGVRSSSTCEDDCRTVTEAGASTESYECVITKPCSGVSNCGI